MLLYIGAHNQISNRNDNGKSSGQKKDTHRQAKDLSYLHSGGPQENAACKRIL